MQSSQAWPLIRGNVDQTRFVPEDIRPPLRLRWRHERRSGEHMGVNPISGEGQIAVVTRNTVVEAFDAATGQARWRIGLPKGRKGMQLADADAVRESFALVGGVLIVARQGGLHGYDWASGNGIWEISETSFDSRSDLPEHDFAQGILTVDAAGLVVVASRRGVVRRIVPRTGEVAAMTQTHCHELRAAGPRLVGSYHVNHAQMPDPGDAKAWDKYRVETRPAVLEVASLERGEIALPRRPVHLVHVDGGMVVPANGLSCWDLDLQRQRWAVPRQGWRLSDAYQLASNGRVLVVNHEVGLAGYDMTEGSVRWKTREDLSVYPKEAGAYFIRNALVVSPHFVYALHCAGAITLRVYEIATGALAWESEPLNRARESEGWDLVGMSVLDAGLIISTGGCLRYLAGG